MSRFLSRERYLLYWLGCCTVVGAGLIYVITTIVIAFVKTLT